MSANNPVVDLDEIKSELFDAVREGRIDRVKSFFKQGLSVNTLHRVGFDQNTTPLIQAASAGNAQMVGFLLGRGAHINHRQADDTTALFHAVRSADNGGRTPKYVIDYPKTIQLLLKAGANPNLANHNRAAPLYFAKEVWLVKALLKGGADPNLHEGSDIFLQHARYKGTLGLLWKAGADADVRDYSGQSALHVAAAHNQLDNVKLLLRAMIPEIVRSKDKNGKTAMHHAAYGGNSEIVRLLLAQGLQPTKDSLQASIEQGYLDVARQQFKALGSAIWPSVGATQSVNLEIYTLILQNQTAKALAVYKAFEASACQGATPLMSAVELGNKEAVAALIALGVNVDYQAPAPLSSYQVEAHPFSSSGHRPTIYVLPPPCDQEHKRLESQLAQRDLRVSRMGATPRELVLPAETQHRLNFNSYGGHITALSLAVRREDIDIARLLLGAGADPSLKSHYPQYAYHSPQIFWLKDKKPKKGKKSEEWKMLLKLP